MFDLSGLNNVQSEAVRCADGPSLIIAGAGSGKTRVLTYKIAYLLDKGISPNAILALTFTNKASKEMKERISSLVGREKAVRLWMGTFHSIFIRFLREHADLIGFPQSFTIYDTSDSKSAIRMCVRELQLDDKVYKASDVLSRISMAKNNLVTATAYKNNGQAVQNDMAARKGRICDVYELYSKKCFAAGVMDFDDILLYMNILLRDHPEVCDKLQQQFSHILVDEYQDTNFSQYLIIKKLSALRRNITVVGDDSQSIYGFRGARIQNILNFKKDYREAKEFRLEQNYRSTQTIVCAANSVIGHNTNRLKKECFSKGDIGEKIEVISSFTEQDEGSSVAASILNRIHDEKASYDQFAVLYRTNSQSRVIEEMLRRRNLPYKIYAGHSFYERAEVKDMLAYFRLVINHNDDESFRRIINFPARGIGDTSLGYLAEAAKVWGVSFWEALTRDGLDAFGLKVAAYTKMRAFVTMISSFVAKKESEDAYTLAMEIANVSGVIASLKNENTIESQAKLENVEELLSGINEFVEEQGKLAAESGTEDAIITLGDYLENVALLTDLDESDDKKDDNNRIKLMTVHSSKGLEFPYVYIVGMEENLFPSSIALASEEEVEEERRLFYVALTRAEKAVSISFSRSRFKWGEHVTNSPSRFLREIDPQYLDHPIEKESLRGSVVGYDDDEEEKYGPSSHSGQYGSSAIGTRSERYSRDGSRYGNGSGAGSAGSASRFGSGSGYGTQSGAPKFIRRDGSVSSRPGFSSSHSVPSSGSGNTASKPGRVDVPRPTMSKTVHTPSSGFSPSDPSDLAVGQRVEHDRFGYGIVKVVDGQMPNKKAVVDFEIGGEKTLLLKYAKLMIVQ